MPSMNTPRYSFDSVAASPGVSLERGNYRMRGPNLRPLPALFQDHKPSTSSAAPRATPRQHRVDPHLAFLVILLTVGCLTCFSTAYYLFSTRWAVRAAYSSSVHADLSTEVTASEGTAGSCNASRRYLAYLPHSGFHNQRIAFENALLLAHVLHRTLLVPPIRLGTKPIRYVEYDTLFQFVQQSDKQGLMHCPQIPQYLSRPPECLHYFESAYIPWTWLVDLSALAARQDLCYLPTMSRPWIEHNLDIDASDIFTLRDHAPYQFRFVDTDQDLSNRGKYEEDVSIAHLASRNEKLVQIGTLFGTSRLHLEHPDNIAYRNTIRQSMFFANKDLAVVAASIARDLGDSYIALHLRSGDGLFQAKFGLTVVTSWWRILHDIIGLPVSSICRLEVTLGLAPSLYCTGRSAHLEKGSLATVLPLPTSVGNHNCRGRKYVEHHLLPLNIPLYIATDLPAPDTHQELAVLRETFPCLFFLGDFKQHLEPLRSLKSTHDGVNIFEFTLPFVDAMVAGKALRVVGTEGSTFSKFVTDILWASHGSAL